MNGVNTKEGLLSVITRALTKFEQMKLRKGKILLNIRKIFTTGLVSPRGYCKPLCLGFMNVKASSVLRVVDWIIQ